MGKRRPRRFKNRPSHPFARSGFGDATDLGGNGRIYAGDRGINQNSGIRPFRPGFWKGPGEYDFSAVDEDFRLILGDSKPGENYLIPRLMIEPPSWWDKANPGELARDAQAKCTEYLAK